MPSKRRPESGVSPSGSRKSTRLKKTKREDDDVQEEAFDDARISPVKTSTPTNKVEEAFVDDGEAPISPVKASTPTNKVEEAFVDDGEAPISPVKASTSTNNVNEEVDDDGPESRFIGKAVPDEEARRRWPHRYKNKQNTASKGLMNNDEGLVSQARCHYTQAEVDGRVIINLYDDAYVQGEDGKPNYICKVIEMFEAVDGNSYFTAQWFYRAKDTVIKDHGNLIDNKRVFFSEIKDDNPLGCLIEKLNIVKVPLNVDLEAHRSTIPDCDYYYDMLYLLPCSTFIKVPQEIMGAGSETISTISSEVNMDGGISDLKLDTEDTFQVQVHQKAEMFLLDLYAGCGAMSTGLCLGANTAGLNLTTRWAVDLNAYACESLKLNHPETEVRNEKADDFLSLLKEWEKLCIMFSLIDGVVSDQYFDSSDVEDDESDEEDNDNNPNNGENDGEIFEVAHILTICYGDPKEKNEPGLHFKVRWKGYGPSEDSWEPLEGLRNCRERVKDFVVNGYKLKILPLRGDVDVICGGPPCQGISGFNRFRNKHSPLNDPKNEQLLVFMDVVDYLKPKFVLMENVVDLLKFSDGYLGRYGLSRLIQMNYQTRMGMMAAGSYGLPQYRNRVFIWGALPTEILPQYPLPTHEVVIRGVYPLEFEENIVRYSEGHVVQLEKKLLLEDAISDLPAVTNDEQRDDMPYGQEPQSNFQQFIRLGKDELLNSMSQSKPSRLFDHRPLQLNPDDYERVCQIPKRKGANFRDLPGVRVRPDNKVEFDPDIERVLLRSGKPLVPDYAMSFVKGSSSKPFARLWWDETVPTVVTRAEPHNQQIIHPEQDRVLSIRENARLQGFPDYYKLCGPVKERYIQVGNAVAVPVARALGYALGLAFQGTTNGEPLFSLPQKFPLMAESLSLVSSEDEA